MTLLEESEPHPSPAPTPQPRLAMSSRDPNPSDADRVLAAAVDLLRQGEALLLVVEAELYACKLAVAFNGSIGGHYRHCLDHFTSLLAGKGSGLVDYDHRGRDPRLEREPETARRHTRALREVLESIDPAALDEPVAVRCEVSYQHGDSPLTRSSLGRELVYAIAHGIHHFALIAVMARLQGVTLPENFGIAPSTVAHHTGLKAQ